MWRGCATTDDQFAYFTPYESNSVYRYKWSTEKWDELPPSPYYDSGLVIIDGELTAVGGYHYRYINTVFTLQQDEWVEHYPPMNTARSSPAVVKTSAGNHIFVIGGSVDIWSATVELFYVRSRRWYELTNLPQALQFPSATICGNQLHVIGCDGAGYSCPHTALISSDEPIPSKNILPWTPLPQQPVNGSTAATLCGQLVIVGGEHILGPKPSCEREKGKPALGGVWVRDNGKQGMSRVNTIHQLIDEQWVEIGPMSSGKRRCLVVTPSPEKMIIVGGYGGGDSVEEYVVV